MLTALATSFYAKMLCIHLGEVLHDVSYLRYTSGIRIVLETVLLKLHVKLAPGWALIRVNFDPIQEIGAKVGALFREWALFHETTVQCENPLAVQYHISNCVPHAPVKH